MIMIIMLYPCLNVSNIQWQIIKMKIKFLYILRTTVPLVSYIRNSLRFWYNTALSTCCQNLEKNWGHRENLGKDGGQTLRDLTEKSINFSTLAACNIRLLIFLWRGSMSEIGPFGEKKFMITEEKLGKMKTFWRNNLPSWVQILSEDLPWL